MGAEPYWYYVKYQPDINAALQELRQREFKAGRYNPVTPFPVDLFPIGPDSPTPGAQHATIQEALADTEGDGTRSILDIDHVSDGPTDYGAATPLPESIMESVFNTTKPTREMVEENWNFFDYVERGQAIYVTIYKDGEPDKILFAGYSFD